MNTPPRDEIYGIVDKIRAGYSVLLATDEILNLIASKMPEKPPEGVDPICFKLVITEVKSILKGETE